MARRKPKKQAQQESAADDDLEILHPDREVRVNGETVTVREYRFVEGLRLRATAAPLVEALGELMQRNVDLDQVYALLADHEELLLELMALSIDKPVEFVAGLDGPEGELLMDTWWVVNASFFTRAVQRRLLAARAHRLTAATRDFVGGTSTERSSPTDTPPDSSGNTPTDS